MPSTKTKPKDMGLFSFDSDLPSKKTTIVEADNESENSVSD